MQVDLCRGTYMGRKGVITKCTAEMVYVRLAGDAPEVRMRKTSVVERRETPRSDQDSGAAAAAA
jgi:hypothetical protein